MMKGRKCEKPAMDIRKIHAVFCLRTLFIRTSASDMVKKYEHSKNMPRLRFLHEYVPKYAFI